MKGPKALCMLHFIFYVMSLFLAMFTCFSKADMFCILHQQFLMPDSYVSQWLSGIVHVTSWRIAKVITQLMWCIVWDLVETIDNQCLGLGKKTQSIMK